MDGEQRRLGDASKNLRKAERRIKELDFQAKIYIPNTIRTQKNYFQSGHGSTENFCNLAKVAYFLGCFSYFLEPNIYKIKRF